MSPSNYSYETQNNHSIHQFEWLSSSKHSLNASLIVRVVHICDGTEVGSSAQVCARLWVLIAHRIGMVIAVPQKNSLQSFHHK